MRSAICLLALVVLCIATKPITLDLVRMAPKHTELSATPRDYRTKLQGGHTVPIGGSILWKPTGAYYANVTVGSPPQAVLALLDSGSSDLLVTTKMCEGCNKNKAIEFEPKDSSSIKNVACNDPDIRCQKCGSEGCEFMNAYLTCAPDPNQVCIMKGPIYRDVFGVEGTNLGTPVNFGAISFMNITFPGGLNGISAIWGLSYRGTTSYNEVPAFQALVDAHQLDNVFSMCLHERGGKITLGGIDESLYTGDISYTPVTSDYYYSMRMLDLEVGGESLGFDPTFWNANGGSVLDSGTYSLYVPDKAYKQIFKALTLLCDKQTLTGICGLSFQDSLFGGKCFSLTSDQLDAFPNLTVVLDGVKLTVEPVYYLLNYGSQTNSSYCLGIQNGGPGSLTIHGDVVMLGYYTIFDRANKQIGFAKRNTANC
mmetsp:Transcript_5780/g.6281  ORF Transcript_5780/g.6281 Transcript_5780/m.6281 type:complete len:425 (+) Transcript_5780:1-1275(+)